MAVSVTLNTTVYVIDDVDLRELFHTCQQLLTPYDAEHREPDQQISYVKPKRIGNRLGQGLPAILEIETGGERPCWTEQQAVEHNEYCNLPGLPYYDSTEPPCTKSTHGVPCWYEVSFDTAYSWSGAGGAGCGDLHASLVTRLGRWLDDRGVRWKWRDEQTGKVHEGYEALDALGSLIAADSASDR
jgi:hypothetical protein